MTEALSTMEVKPKRVNFYIDLKNITQTVYLEFVVKYLVHDTTETGRVSPWIFMAFLKYLVYHKKWALKNGIDARFYVFFESGSSFYHAQHYKDYKSKRKIDQFYGLSRADVDLFRDIWQKNLMLIEKACHKMANISVIHLKRLEADFVPFYIMSRGLVESGQDILHFTYSTDKDLFQNTIAAENSIIFRRVKKDLRIIQKGDIIELYTKKKNEINPEYFPVLLALTGDSGDDVPQLKKGLGVVSCLKMINEVVEICGSPNDIIEKSHKGEMLFENEVGVKNRNTNIRTVCELEKEFRRNVNLVSFECLCRNIDNPRHTNWLEIRKYLQQRVAENTQKASKDALKSAMEQLGIFISEYEFSLLMDEVISYEESQRNF